MTKKDFELIANTIYEGEDESAREKLGQIFASVLWKTNPMFNRSKFLEACTTGRHIRKSIAGG